MSQLKILDRARLAVLAADNARRVTLTQIRRSPMFRWRARTVGGDRLTLVPQDLRTTDPSFATELSDGFIGLAGHVVDITDANPFKIAPVNPDWARALHGFAWLRHMHAEGSEDVRQTARRLTLQWIETCRRDTGVGWQAEVVARRVMAWLTQAGFLLDDIDQAGYEAILGSLNAQLNHLSAAHQDAPPGLPRLQALTALIFAGLCIEDSQRLLDDHESAFEAELSAQILTDGGHIGRLSSTLVDALLDLLPLKQCYIARDLTPPEFLLDAIQRMILMLRYVRMGDGTLARFNGVGATRFDTLATVLAYDDVQANPLLTAHPSGYQRAQRRQTIIVMDTGSPPPLELANKAHAGCLSFEMSAAGYPLIVNCGAPGRAFQDWRASGRATAAHSTACFNETSSGRLIEAQKFRRKFGARPVQDPANVTVNASQQQHGAFKIVASHDGYLSRYGIIHTRTLILDALGERLQGLDRLASPHSVLRFKRDYPFTIHFHLHPDIDVRIVGDNAADIIASEEEHWRLRFEGASLAIEESIFLADESGPRNSMQIVLRGVCPGFSEVGWTLERLKDGKLPTNEDEADLKLTKAADDC